MEKIFHVETTLSHDLAELYAEVMEAFEKKSSIPLADMNRTLIQTGMVHHLTMMAGLGLLEADRAERVRELVERVSRNTLMWDVLQMARQYWEKGGGRGGVDFKA